MKLFVKFITTKLATKEKLIALIIAILLYLADRFLLDGSMINQLIEYLKLL